MIAYVDSSALLRVLLGQEGRIGAFEEIERPIASKLLRPECLRALIRCRGTGLLSEEEYLKALDQLYRALDSIELIPISDPVLDRAGAPFAVLLGTFDAIHLASALRWREQQGLSPVIFTHDQDLGKGAKALDFEVLGCSSI